MKLGIGIDRDPAALPPKRQAPNFVYVCCGQTADWIKIALLTQVLFGPGDIVLDGNPGLPPKGGEGGTAAPPIFGN